MATAVTTAVVADSAAPVKKVNIPEDTQGLEAR